MNEAYLNYAEALNEYNEGPTQEAYDAINTIRKRSGQPDLPTGLGYLEFRAKVRNERAIELAFDGHRFYDIRRWMIADQDGEGRQFGYVHGMNMNAAEDKFYEEVEASPIVFRRKMYLYPIPDDEMKKTELLVQNPGW